jgi:hypothetical protein
MSSSRRPKANSKTGVVALALTWDGARCPVRSLPAKARAFLRGNAEKISILSSGAVSALFVDDQVREIRICWVPRLQGGSEVLSELFETADGKRLAFQAIKSVRFGEMLGVVYRRQKGTPLP